MPKSKGTSKRRSSSHADMRPAEFLQYDPSGDYNTPYGVIAEALKADIVIRSSLSDYAVLSYFYCQEENRMVLEIEPM